MSRPLIILFAKAPVAGRVKTRLCPPLTPEQATELHTALVADTCAMLASLDVVADTELSTDLPTDAWPCCPSSRCVQPPGDLGARLFHALDRGLSSGRPVVMVLGSDSPGLPADHIRDLLRSPADVTLGPTEDGGFFAIACRRIHARMFANVRWSGPQALADVVVQASACGLGVALGAPWFDIDVEADLRRLVGTPEPGGQTAQWARRYREQ